MARSFASSEVAPPAEGWANLFDDGGRRAVTVVGEPVAIDLVPVAPNGTRGDWLSGQT